MAFIEASAMIPLSLSLSLSLYYTFRLSCSVRNTILKKYVTHSTKLITSDIPVI